jgi:hypothetical protein
MAHMASRTVTQVRTKIETRYANTFAPSCSEKQSFSALVFKSTVAMSERGAHPSMVFLASGHEGAQHLAKCGLSLCIWLVTAASIAVCVELTVTVRVEHSVLELLVPFALEYRLPLDADRLGRASPQY